MSHVSGAETSLRWGTEGGTVRREIVISQTRGCENGRQSMDCREELCQ